MFVNCPFFFVGDTIRWTNIVLVVKFYYSKGPILYNGSQILYNGSQINTFQTDNRFKTLTLSICVLFPSFIPTACKILFLAEISAHFSHRPSFQGYIYAQRHIVFFLFHFTPCLPKLTLALKFCQHVQSFQQDKVILQGCISLFFRFIQSRIFFPFH